MRIALIGRGTYYRELVGDCNDNVSFFRGRRGYADLIINWGLTGSRFRDTTTNNSAPVLNKPPNATKYTQLTKVAAVGVPCPETQLADPRNDSWLFKPMFSLGGRNICLATNRPIAGNIDGYYQKFIPGADRRYELRVHAVTWLDESEYLVQKRVHDDGENQITWNNHTGGRFVTVNSPNEYRIFREAMKYATMALKAIGVEFGGVDFIVTHDGDIFFLEVNMSIGFTMDRTREFWVNAINMLTDMDMQELQTRIKEDAVSPDPVPLEFSPVTTPVNEEHRRAVEEVIKIFSNGFVITSETTGAVLYLDRWLHGRGE